MLPMLRSFLLACASDLVWIVVHVETYVYISTRLTKTARETPSVHQLRNAREMVIIMWHEKWTVDGVSCGDYDELRGGVCEGE